jgi:hypothetical protein
MAPRQSRLVGWRTSSFAKEVIEAGRVARDRVPKELDALLRHKSDLDSRTRRMYTVMTYVQP